MTQWLSFVNFIYFLMLFTLLHIKWGCNLSTSKLQRSMILQQIMMAPNETCIQKIFLSLQLFWMPVRRIVLISMIKALNFFLSISIQRYHSHYILTRSTFTHNSSITFINNDYTSPFISFILYKADHKHKET